MRTEEVRPGIEEIKPTRDRALIEVIRKGTDDEVHESGLIVIHGTDSKQWKPEFDYEIGTVRALGEGDEWEPVEVGDQVMVRAPSGGQAGSDIGHVVGGTKNGALIIVKVEEIVCKMVD